MISVVVPVYNVEKYIKKCIDSILNQTYKEFELIIVDDGSSDSSGLICDEYSNIDEHIKVFHKKNGGLSDARNYGIIKSSGEYITFVDSDDFIAPQMIEMLYKKLSENNCDISICDPVHCFENDSAEFELANRTMILNSEKAIEKLFYQKSFLTSAWGKLYKKELFANLKFPVGMLFEDSAIMYKLFERANNICYFSAKLYGYLHRESSITTSRFSERDFDILKITHEIIDHYSDVNFYSKKLYKAAVTYHLNAAFRIFLNATSEFKNHKMYIDSKEIIKNYKCNVLFNLNVRIKTKFAIIMYIISKKALKKIYIKVDRWK